MEFSRCDMLQAGTIGPDLLRAIRDVAFVGMQGTQVSESEAQCAIISISIRKTVSRTECISLHNHH